MKTKVHLVADKKKWRKSRKGLLKLLDSCKPTKNTSPLKLDDLLKQIYKVKRQRRKTPFEIYFPSLEARNRFMAAMKTCKKK